MAKRDIDLGTFKVERLMPTVPQRTLWSALDSLDALLHSGRSNGDQKRQDKRNGTNHDGSHLTVAKRNVACAESTGGNRGSGRGPHELWRVGWHVGNPCTSRACEECNHGGSNYKEVGDVNAENR